MSNANGKELLAAAWSALKQDREMLLFPVVGGIVSMLAIGVFFGAVFLTTGSAAQTSSAVYWVVAAISIWVTTVIGVWVNTAIVAGAMLRMSGGDPTLGYCAAKANARLPQILGWATLTAVVGLVLRFIAEEAGVVGKIIAALLGGGWAIVTYFAVPVLLEEGTGPFASVKRSKDIMFATFGKAVRTNIRYGLVVIAWLFGSIALAAAGMYLLAGNQVVLGVVVLAVTVAVFVIGALIINVLGMFIRTALYRYATGLPVPGVPVEAMQGAFVTRG